MADNAPRRGRPPDVHPRPQGCGPLGRKGKVSGISLASHLHAAMSEEEIYRWLRMVAAGKDPDIERDESGAPLVGRLENPPDWTTRRAAFAMLLDRRNGKAAQHVTIEGELRASIGVAAISIDAATLAALPAEKKAQLRALLREVVTQPRQQLLLDTAAATAREQTTQYMIDAARQAEDDEGNDDEG